MKFYVLTPKQESNFVIPYLATNLKWSVPNEEPEVWFDRVSNSF